MTSDDRPMADRPGPDDGVTPGDVELLAMARRGGEVLAGTDRAHVASLWDGIAAAAFRDEAHPSGPDAGREADPDVHTSPRSPALGVVAESVSSPTAAPAGDVVDLAAARRRRRAGWLAAVAAAAVLVVAVGASVLVGSDTTPAPVATFALDALDDRATEVDGTIVADGDQTLVEVDLASLPPAPDGTFYELWLLDADAGRLVSLGPVEAQGSFVVPAAVDIGEWPLLDVSVEPVDGDPTHSSDSVLRGEIVAAGPTGGS